jgi:hypothetical protein
VFIDEVEISVQGGHGGAGKVSFGKKPSPVLTVGMVEEEETYILKQIMTSPS